MDFGELLGSAWKIAWRHKYLWALGLFALTLDGCGSGPGMSFDFGPDDFGFDAAPDGIIPGEPWFWFGLAVVVVAVGLVLFIVSIMAAAGLVAGTDDAYRQVPHRSLGSAWRRGVRRFWPLLGLVLLIAVAGFLVFVMVAVAIGVPIAVLLLRGDTPPIAAVAGIIALAIVIGLLSIVLAVAVRIVLSWSYRSLVLEKTGVFQSLAAGWRLFRGNLGSSVLIWAIAFGLSIAIGLIIGMPLLALFLPAILALGFLDDPGVAVPLALAAGLFAFLVGLLLKAFGSTFFTAYWTVAYRKLTETEEGPVIAEDRPAAAPDPVPGDQG